MRLSWNADIMSVFSHPQAVPTPVVSPEPEPETKPEQPTNTTESKSSLSRSETHTQLSQCIHIDCKVATWPLYVLATSFDLSPLHPSPPDPCAVVDCVPGYRCEVYVPTLEAVCAPYCELENGGCPLNQRCQLRQVQCSRNPCPPAVDCLDIEGEDRS